MQPDREEGRVFNEARSASEGVIENPRIRRDRDPLAPFRLTLTSTPRHLAATTQVQQRGAPGASTGFFHVSSPTPRTRASLPRPLVCAIFTPGPGNPLART